MHDVVFVPLETVHVPSPPFTVWSGSLPWLVKSLCCELIIFTIPLLATERYFLLWQYQHPCSFWFGFGVWGGECLFDYHSERAGWKSLISSSVQYGNSSLLSQEASPFLPSFFLFRVLVFLFALPIISKIDSKRKGRFFPRHYHFKFSLERFFFFLLWKLPRRFKKGRMMFSLKLSSW